MKYNHLFILFFCFFSLVGCKDKATDKSEESTEAQETVKTFEVALKFSAKKDDDFCLLYTEDGTINFGEKGIWKAIKGSENEQEVTFTLPADTYPTQLRFDLGRKKDQEDITIKGVRMSYMGKTFEVYGPKFWLYFRADANQCAADENTGIVKAVVKDGERKTPSIAPNQDVLGPELVKLGKQ